MAAQPRNWAGAEFYSAGRFCSSTQPPIQMAKDGIAEDGKKAGVCIYTFTAI